MSTPSAFMRKAAPYAWIVLAGLAAHGWCLGSQFYLDDHWQIAESEYVEGGQWWKLQWWQWTLFTYWLTYQIFGMSPAAFHAVNLALHIGSGCVVVAAGREFLRGTEWAGAGRFDVALLAGLLFTVHPLGSEIPNYARCRDLAWVTLFSLLAAWCTVLWLRRGWRWFPWILVFITGAAYSKGPGLWHALMMVGAVFLGCATTERARALVFDRWRWWLVAGVLAGGAIAYKWWSLAVDRFTDPRFGWHVLTLCRVLWEFVRRYLWPVNLSADHHIPWTEWAGDVPAWLAAAAVALWLGVIAFCFLKPRLRMLGVFQFLFVGALLSRAAYVMNELMPEYRIYPGLPWLALFVAAVAGKAFGRAKAWGAAVGAAIVIALAIVSAERATFWWDEERLAQDVLRQYPTQVRAIWLLQARDFKAGRYEKVIARHHHDYQLAAGLLQTYNGGNRWKRKYDEGLLALADVGAWGYYARATAEVNGPGEALAVMARVHQNMEAHRLEDDVYWWIFHHDRGMIYAKAGMYEKALEDLEKGRWLYAWRKDEAWVREMADGEGEEGRR